MPLELGLFLGAKRFGGATHRDKSCLILDREPFRYQKFISDIAGQDVRAHDGSAELAIGHVRERLAGASGRKMLPGGASIWSRYRQFNDELPVLMTRPQLLNSELTFNDRSNLIEFWLRETDGV